MRLPILQLELLNFDLELFDFFAQSSLNWVRIEEPLDFFIAEEELFFNQSLHVSVTIDHGTHEICKLGVLRDFWLGKGARLIWINGFESEPVWEVAQGIHEIIEFFLNLEDFLGGINLIVIATAARVDFQVGPDHSLLVKQSGEDLLQHGVFHVQDLSHYEHRVDLLGLLSQD